jgi:hypothetical protein
MKSEPPGPAPPMTLGNAAAAHVRLIASHLDPKGNPRQTQTRAAPRAFAAAEADR